MNARISAANTVIIVFMNNSGGALSLVAGTYNFTIIQ
jgi:hypothetical protein